MPFPHSSQKMLSHLTAEDEEVTEFIQLASINRNLAIIIDSDKEDEADSLNETKERVLQAMEDYGALSWVTSGYTIENYVSTDVLEEVLRKQYPKSEYLMPQGRYVSPVGNTFKGTKNRYPSKVTVARSVADKNVPPEEWPLDLQVRVTELVKCIRKANG